MPGIALVITANNHHPEGSLNPEVKGGSSSTFLGIRDNKFIFPGILLIILITLAIGFRNTLFANLYANLGAVDMSRAELQNWPLNKWNENPDVSSLVVAKN